MLKSKKLFFIIGVPVIALILVFVLGLAAIRKDEYGRIQIWHLAGKDEHGFYQRRLSIHEKPHSLDKFSKIKIGMEPHEVYELVGKPTDSQGSGIIWLRYRIGKEWSVNLHFGGGEIGGKLSDIRVVDYPNDRIFVPQDDNCCHRLVHHLKQHDDGK